MSDLPAILGGERLVGANVPMTQPTMPPLEDFIADLREMFSTRMITNHVYVKRFEGAIKERTGVAHAVAVSSCTSGLMLALSRYKRKGGSVVLPSYTFSATGHAIVWNGLRLRPVDIDPETFLVDTDQVERARKLLARLDRVQNLFQKLQILQGNQSSHWLAPPGNSHSLVEIVDSVE
jgi:hypothetical protein